MTQSAAAPSALDESELSARVASLSLEQKVRLLTGADFWSLHSEPAVGLRRLVLSDGPAGVRGERWDERYPSANVPSPTALAATWDEELVEELAGLLASEARRKGVDVVLAPTVNLHRTPYAGRHFECFSEDPLLTARIGVSYVCSLLRETLQGELEFDGLAMSDWFATRSTVASARAALDLVMPGPVGPWGDSLVDAVRAGQVDPATVDDKVVRILRLAARGALPLDATAVERIAIIGPNAATARTLGGGSATVFPPYTVSPLEGLGSALEPGVEILHSPPGDDPGYVGVNFQQLNLAPPYRGDDHEIERAAAVAGAADAVVLVVGTTEEVESEGFDRGSLSLPGRQDELVRRVAATNPNTIVVVNAGAPVLMPWAQDVAAVLLAWFPGQEFGNALADVLLGLAEPGGRLPTTWPASEAGLPSIRPIDGILRYDEGLSVGYRNPGRDTLFPFGHGLGFSSWEYESMDAPRRARPGAAVRVTIGVRNVGGRRSREVVQVYASRPDSAIERPHRWLVGFAGVLAEPGEPASATIIVPSRAFEHWSVQDGRWVLEPGTFDLAAGASSAMLPMSTRITVS